MKCRLFVLRTEAALYGSDWSALSLWQASAPRLNSRSMGSMAFMIPRRSSGKAMRITPLGRGMGFTCCPRPVFLGWNPPGSIFDTPPDWTAEAVPDFEGSFWAPDIAYFNDRYHVYYSVSSWGSIDSAIGLVATPSPDISCSLSPAISTGKGDGSNCNAGVISVTRGFYKWRNSCASSATPPKSRVPGPAGRFTDNCVTFLSHSFVLFSEII